LIALYILKIPYIINKVANAPPAIGLNSIKNQFLAKTNPPMKRYKSPIIILIISLIIATKIRIKPKYKIKTIAYSLF
jgi:hypothetical protein